MRHYGLVTSHHPRDFSSIRPAAHPAIRLGGAMKRPALALLMLFALPATIHAQGGPIPRAQPKYTVRVDSSVMVPMRDGVKLSTDIYYPVGAGEKLPVIMTRSPYDKNTFRATTSDAYFFAGQGYVMVVQDVRGKYESEGQPYIDAIADTDDGDDAITWAATQPWS